LFGVLSFQVSVMGWQSLEAMKSILFKMLGRAGDLVDVQPALALFIGGAFLAVFLSAIFCPTRTVEAHTGPGLFWPVFQQLKRFLWAASLVGFLLGALTLVRVYLHQTVAGFQRTHGRVTEANFRAIQTIWGTPQEQHELRFDLYWDEEVTERIESEDVTKPAVLRKKMVRHEITSNPFLAARHEVTLRQNARKKGSALYGGYETECRFTWRLINPADRDLSSLLRFPLPAATSIYDDLSATLNGKDILPQMQIKDGALLLSREVKARERLDLAISFKSRGMSYWYLQVQEPREIRDFIFTLTLPDLTKGHLNFPEGCMTPTAIQPTTDKRGTVLRFRLDHAISNKGMGIALPTVSQPGETTNAVLGEIERGWLLTFAMLVLGLTLAATSHAVMASVLFGAIAACAYGLVGDFSDLLFGFWGTAGLVFVPSFAVLAWLLMRVAPRASGRILGSQLLLFGIVYPWVAGLDADRQGLYFDLAAIIFLVCAAWEIRRRMETNGATFFRQEIGFKTS
jgi:hypothetical protein